MNTETIKANNLNVGNRNIIFYVLVIMIPVTIFLISGELLARFFALPQVLPDPPPPSRIDPFQANPYIVKMRPYLYSHIPGSTYIQARADYEVKYEINSMGFRGPEIPPQKPDGMKRLLVIGDSIVEGHGSELTETFAYLLRENLRSSGWEVVNVGVQGASPIYFAANLDRYLSLGPDAVLIVTYENDLYEDRVREAEYFQLPFFDDADRLRLRSPGDNILSASRFLTTLRKEWRKLVTSTVEKNILHNQAYLRASEEQWGLLRSSANRVQSSFLDQQWLMSQPYMDYLAISFRENKVQLFVASLGLAAFQPNSSYRVHVYHVDQLLSTWAEEKQIPFLSLLPTIDQAFHEKEISDIIINGDGHPTPQTHAMIEAALRPWLLQYLDGNELKADE